MRIVEIAVTKVLTDIQFCGIFYRYMIYCSNGYQYGKTSPKIL